jgi:hypothetical protein
VQETMELFIFARFHGDRDKRMPLRLRSETCSLPLGRSQAAGPFSTFALPKIRGYFMCIRAG